MTPIHVCEEPTTALVEYARTTIAFEVQVVLEIVGSAPPFSWVERLVETPYTKDYDALDGGPTTWPRRPRVPPLDRGDTEHQRPRVRFYSGLGCVLEHVQRRAYAGLPEEVKLVWSKDVSLLDDSEEWPGRDPGPSRTR